MMKYLQRIGKSLMLPIAVLPICGLLMGIGYLLCPVSMQGGEVVGLVAKIGYYMVKAGSAVIDNMALLFVIGISLGMSDDNHGSACLSGLISWLVVTTMLSGIVMSTIFPKAMENEVTALAFSKIQNPFIGILCGIVGAECYNKFKGIKFPDVFAFFSGRRFVAIVTMLTSLVMCIILALVWPLLFRGLIFLGEKIVATKGIGVGVYTFLNRLLIPTGLHHALNNVFWFDTIGIGDLTNYWSGSDGSGLSWSLGMYMSGFFPPMMFGVPGAALAMYHCSKNKKKVRGVLFSVAACAVVCGVTEPFEFLFIFTAFPLYVVYSVLYGIMAVITYYVGFRAGFAFSGGITDLIFSASLPAAAKTWLIIPLGAASFAIFYSVFRFMITKFHIRFPGLEEDAPTLSNADSTFSISSDNKYAVTAAKVIAAVGGVKNIVNVDCCATRLRFDLIDNSIVDRDQAKAAGAIGVVNVGKSSIQVIIGVTVQYVCDELKELLKNPAALEVYASAGKAAADAPAEIHVERSADAPLSSGIRRVVKHGDNIPLGNAGDGARSASGHAEFSYVITDKLGIHARPAGELAKLMRGFDCTVTVSANGKSAGAKSTIDLMSLGVTEGAEITVAADGAGASQAVAAAKEFLERKL